MGRREVGRSEHGRWVRREDGQPQRATVTQSPFEMLDPGLAHAICFVYPPLRFAKQRTEVVTNKSHSVQWWARRSNQSTRKEINPEYSLEGLMLKRKLQSFCHLVRTADSLEKTPMLGKIEGGRRRG